MEKKRARKQRSTWLETSEGDEGGVGPASGEARGGHALSQAAPIETRLGRILGGTFYGDNLRVPV